MSATDRNGFTLIELIVTISIGMVLLGGSLAGFLSFQERRKVEAAAREVHQLYVTAKSNAAARKLPYADYSTRTSGCNNNDNRLLGYVVILTSTSFHLTASCQAADSNLPKTTVSLVGSTPSITNQPTGGIIFYSLPVDGALTNLSAGTAIVTISGSSIEYSFTISRSGAISNVQKVP